MSIKTPEVMLTILVVFSASIALADGSVKSRQMEACVGSNCMLRGQAMHVVPRGTNFRTLAQNTVLQKVNLIDYSKKKRDPRRKPEQVGFDPNMFTPVGTISPNQRTIDPDVRNWNKDGTPTWIEKGGSAATSFMVSPSHVLTNYHTVFGGSTNPNTTDYSATVTVRDPKTGTLVPIMVKPVDGY
jgi:hypothetical protein